MLYNHREGTLKDDSCVVALFCMRSILSSNQNSAFIAYGQELYLQGFHTASSFIVNLESSKPFSVITVFINSRSRSSEPFY